MTTALRCRRCGLRDYEQRSHAELFVDQFVSVYTGREGPNLCPACRDIQTLEAVKIMAVVMAFGATAGAIINKYALMVLPLALLLAWLTRSIVEQNLRIQRRLRDRAVAIEEGTAAALATPEVCDTCAVHGFEAPDNIAVVVERSVRGRRSSICVHCRSVRRWRSLRVWGPLGGEFMLAGVVFAAYALAGPDQALMASPGLLVLPLITWALANAQLINAHERRDRAITRQRH